MNQMAINIEKGEFAWRLCDNVCVIDLLVEGASHGKCPLNNLSFLGVKCG